MKKITRIIGFIAIFMLFLMINNNKVYAASASVSASATTVEPGTKVSVTAKITSTEVWNLSLSSSGGTLSGTTSNTDVADGEVSKQVISATFVANAEGTYTISLNGQIAGSDLVKKPISQSVTIKVAKKEIVLSSDATLTNLGINPYDFSGFKPDTLSYNVTVPKEVSSINIYANKRAGQTVTGIGNKNLNIGKNTFSITVTAEDKKTTKTYTINVTRESVSKVATLKNLGIKPNDFNNFKSGIFNYKVNVPNDVDKINIYAEKTNANSSVTGTGDKSLEIGSNTFKIVVTAEDKKTTRTYTLVVNRLDEKDETKHNEEEENKEDENEDTKDTEAEGLIGLEIAGFTLSPEFDNKVYEYKTEITDEVKELDIKTKTSSDKIKVEIIGNEKLQLGENLITILVKNEDDTKSTYQITANAKQTPVDVSDLNNEINDAQGRIQKQKIIVIVTIIAVIVLSGIFLIKKYMINRDDSEYDYEEDDDEEIDHDLDNNKEAMNFVMDREEKPEFKNNFEEDDDERYKQILEERGFNVDEEYEETKQKKWNAKGKRYK